MGNQGLRSITDMATTPAFRNDKSFIEEGGRGTASPKTVNRIQSDGCVRLANWHAIRLPGLVRPGSRLIVK